MGCTCACTQAPKKHRGPPKTSRLLTPVGEGQVPACRHLLQTAAKVLKPYQAHLQCPTGFEPKAQISQIWAAISKFAFSINLHQCSSGPCKFPHCRLQDFFFLLKLQRKKHQKTRLTKKGGGRASFLFSKVCHSKLGHTPIFFFAAAPQSNCK